MDLINNEDVVSSNIEITKSTNKKVIKKKDVGKSLKDYHSHIKEMSKKIVKHAITLSPTNLLSVKMAIMESMREVERRMRENELHG